MIPLSSASAVSGGLTWQKISLKNVYELRQSNELVGTLQRPSFWSSSYVAETDGGRWTFRRCGFLGGGAEILDESSQQPIATFKPIWGSGGGTLTFRDGQSFQVECHGWWRPVWSVIGAGAATLLRLHTRERSVEVQPSDVPDHRMALLVVFTWYRVLQAEEDAAAAVVVAAVS